MVMSELCRKHRGPLSPNESVNQCACVTSTSSTSTVDRVNIGSEHKAHPKHFNVHPTTTTSIIIWPFPT